jgi:hypothetical protein
MSSIIITDDRNLQCDFPRTVFSLNVVGMATSFQAAHEAVLGLLFVLPPVPYTIAA